MSLKNKENSKAYLVGGGIASLATALYLIKDANFKGENIKIFDESTNFGGSLNIQDLSSSDGYVMRGIRMFEEKTFTCAFDLMSQIPSLNVPGKNLREEFITFNEKNKPYSKSRLLKNGKAIDSRPLRLNLKDRLNIFTLLFRRESSLEDIKIEDYFSPSFFISNFWYEFCTVFAFQPWHSLIEFRRYFIQFIQSFPSIDTLETVEIAPHNQYEFLVLPLIDLLKKRGVIFEAETRITDISFKADQNKKIVNKLYCNQNENNSEISITEEDYVFVTLGSLVANSSLGSMTKAPSLDCIPKSASWTLWENISKDKPEFGKPAVFNSYIDKSKWTSFTITFRDPTFFNLIDKFISKKVTAYGGVNLIDSNWFMSIVLSYNPYFINQPQDVTLCWGYGLFPDKKGNYVQKKMLECTGEEILTELIYHLGMEKDLEIILKNAVCIPCMTPFITSLFLPRKKEDRPLIVPKNSINLAFLGQYCEIPKSVVFTIEHSIRSAQLAVYSLLKVDKKTTPIYNGFHHFKVIYNAIKTLLR